MSSTSSSSLLAVVRNVSSLLFPLEPIPSRRQRIERLQETLHSTEEEEEDFEVAHDSEQSQQQNNQQQALVQVRGRHKMKKEDKYFIKVCDNYLLELSLTTDIVGKDCLHKVSLLATFYKHVFKMFTF